MNDMTVKRILAICVLLAAWELLPRVGAVNPLFIPPFSGVLSALADLNESGELARHTLVSLERALAGLSAAVVLGLPLGLILGGWFPRIQQAAEPLMELFAQANPVILAHIIIFFLGIGQSAKIFIIAWLCIWPITFSTITGLKTVDPGLIKAARSLGLGRGELFLRVVLPASAPSIFTGLRLAAGYAFIMLIAAEMMGASSGLGFLVIQSQESYNVTRIFAGASIITFFAVATDLLIKGVERRVVVWNDTASQDFLKLPRAVPEQS